MSGPMPGCGVCHYAFVWQPFLALFVYARLISLWSVRLLGGRGAGASLTLGEQQRGGQEACIIFGVVD